MSDRPAPTESGEILVRMPLLADTLVEGTVAQWLKRAGDTVLSGEPLATIETDKVTSELTAPGAGIVLELLVPEGQAVPVRSVIARIGTSQSPARSGPMDTGDVAADASPAASYPALVRASAKSTPLAARLLAEHGLTAGQVAGGSTARVTKDQVLHYIQSQTDRVAVIESAAPATSPVRTPPGGDATSFIPLTPMRRAIAEHMVKAKSTIPHGQTVMQANVTRLTEWREQQKSGFEQREAARLTFTVFFVQALARGLVSSGVAASRPIDLGVAVALETGLIVPVVRRADSLTLGETARAVKDLANRARAGRLSVEETHGALMTVTNVGSFGNLTAAPIIPMGQMGILGPGIVERRLFPSANGGIQPGWSCFLSLMFDRRAVTDFAADRLLRAVVDELDHMAHVILPV